MTESGLWKYIRNGLVGKCHITRIESSAGNGVPDVTLGLPGKTIWIELKYTKEWPKRETTKLKMPLRPEQKHWIKQRGLISGNVWVMWRIEDEFFLMPWKECEKLTEVGATQEDMITHSYFYSSKRIDFEELESVLNYGC